MQDYDLDTYLGPALPITDEQREAIHRASDMIEARYPITDPDDDSGTLEDRGAAFDAAVMLILGDSTLRDTAEQYAAANRARAAAIAALTGAIIAASDTLSERAITETTRLARDTVRKALGK